MTIICTIKYKATINTRYFYYNIHKKIPKMCALQLFGTGNNM